MEFDFTPNHSVWGCEGSHMTSPITNLYPLSCLWEDISHTHFSLAFSTTSFISKHHCTLHKLKRYSMALMQHFLYCVLIKHYFSILKSKQPFITRAPLPSQHLFMGVFLHSLGALWAFTLWGEAGGGGHSRPCTPSQRCPKVEEPTQLLKFSNAKGTWVWLEDTVGWNANLGVKLMVRLRLRNEASTRGDNE